MSLTAISLRRSALNALLGTHKNPVLNEASSSAKTRGDKDIASQLAASMLGFKSAAFNATGTQINYAKLRASDSYQHYKYQLAPQLATIDLTALRAPNQRLAFWINLYNSLTIDAVISLGVSKSVTEGWLGILRFFRLAAYNIAGQRYSLEDIEHGILRANRGLPHFSEGHFTADDPRFAHIIQPVDARIHFALNCGSVSCPPIGVYSAADLDKQLNLSLENFAHNETQLANSGRHLKISSIFKWYSSDFGGETGIRDLLLKTLPAHDPRHAFLSLNKPKPFRFFPYNWNLNI
jgi:hypothetical protein